MQPDVLQPSVWQMLPGVVFMIIWAVVMIAVLIAFFRGMRALTQIAATMERIEARLATRAGADSSGVI